MNAKKLSDAFGILAWNNSGHGNWYFRSNCLNRFVGLGFHDKLNDTTSIGTELQYDFFGKNKGIMGNPFFWRLGGCY